jgi:hypothetical protein
LQVKSSGVQKSFFEINLRINQFTELIL